MSLYRRGNVWWSRIELEGKAYRFTTKTGNKNLARQVEASKRTELVKGVFGLASPTLSSFATRWINSLFGKVKPNTLKFYVANITTLLEFEPLADCRLDRIGPAVIEEFVQWRRKKSLAVITINHDLRTLRRGLHLAAEWNVIQKAPKIKLLPGEHQREYVLSAETVEAFKKEPRPIRWIVPFLCDTGLRRGELCALNWEDVNSVGRSVLVRERQTKYSRRRIPLTKKAEAILAELPRHGDSVFTHEKRRLTVDYLSHAFLRARKRLGLPDGAVLHSTRHTFCTNLGAAGASAFQIQHLAGHSSIVISQRYVPTAASKLDEAISLLEK